MVEEPDRVEAQAFGRLSDPAHRLVLLDRIFDVDEVEDPPLRHEEPEPNWGQRGFLLRLRGQPR